MGQIWEQTQTFWSHILLDVGTFVERFDITTSEGSSSLRSGTQSTTRLPLLARPTLLIQIYCSSAKTKNASLPTTN
jgi:hypothetical protein